MKFARITLCALTAVALIGGCGKSSDPTRVLSGDDTPTLDNTPPSAPDAVSVETDAASGRMRMVWSPSSAADVHKYEILVYDPDPTRENAYVLWHETDNGTSSYSLDPSDIYLTKHYRIRAVDGSGNRSSLTAPVSATLGPAIPAGGSPDGSPLPTMEP